jgi:hypothetical protein
VGILVTKPALPPAAARAFTNVGPQAKLLLYHCYMLQGTFTQKLLMAIIAGFAAACLLWVMRHIVERAFYESNEGWKDMYKATPARKVR